MPLTSKALSGPLQHFFELFMSSEKIFEIIIYLAGNYVYFVKASLETSPSAVHPFHVLSSQSLDLHLFSDGIWSNLSAYCQLLPQTPKSKHQQSMLNIPFI